MTNQKASPNSHESDMIKDSNLQFLILHNDEKNTFDYVIESLIEECNHNSYQAEQCAMLAHHKGKCDILKGVLTELLPIKINLIQRGLTITID